MKRFIGIQEITSDKHKSYGGKEMQLKTFSELVKGKNLQYTCQESEEHPSLDFIVEHLDTVSGVNNLLYKRTLGPDCYRIAISADKFGKDDFLIQILTGTIDDNEAKTGQIPPFLLAKSKSELTLDHEMKRFTRLMNEYHLPRQSGQNKPLETIVYEPKGIKLVSKEKTNGFHQGVFEVKVSKNLTEQKYHVWRDYFEAEVEPVLMNNTTIHEKAKALGEFFYALENNQNLNDPSKLMRRSVLNLLISMQLNGDKKTPNNYAISEEGKERRVCADLGIHQDINNVIQLSQGKKKVQVESLFKYVS